jgi:hypothetical protein
MALFTDNALAIGDTPLVQLNKVVSNNARVLAKIESRQHRTKFKALALTLFLIT